MGQIILTPEEIRKAAITFTSIKKIQDVDALLTANAKTQLQKVRDKISVVEIPKGKSAGYNVDGERYIALAMKWEDWQDLLKELEEGKKEGG